MRNSQWKLNLCALREMAKREKKLRKTTFCASSRLQRHCRSEMNFPLLSVFNKFFFFIFLLLNSDLLRFNRGHRGEPSSKCPKISIDFDLASWTEAKASE